MFNAAAHRAESYYPPSYVINCEMTIIGIYAGKIKWTERWKDNTMSGTIFHKSARKSSIYRNFMVKIDFFLPPCQVWYVTVNSTEITCWFLTHEIKLKTTNYWQNDLFIYSYIIILSIPIPFHFISHWIFLINIKRAKVALGFHIS